ncbi:MAG: insulinase family protein [Acidobacteriota bacterium]|nr:insulinase family protein [Acidobacteriota bacterium]
MNEDFRKSPPEALPAVPFNIPKPVQFELENGLRVVCVEDNRFPTISLRLGTRFGDIDDPADGTGVNSAMASLMTEGTANYGSRELAEEIEKLGGGLSVGSSFDHTVLRLSSLTVHFERMTSLMAEVLLRPAFPENELELYKKNAIEGLKYQRSQPDFLADEQVSSIVYGDHPYSVNSPDERDFAKIGREQVESAWKQGIIPNNSILVVVGDISAEQLRRSLESNLSEWREGTAPTREFQAAPERDRRTLTIVDRPGSTQSNIVLANIAINRTSPDYFPVLLMNQVLGAGASSRLFMNLREEKGYTYGAYSRIHAKQYLGTFEATSEVRSAVTGDSLREFFYELERIRDEDVTEKELDDAKNFLAGVFPIRAETQSGLIGLIVAQQLHGLPDDYLETYRDNVRNVSAAEVRRVANQYVHPDSIAIVVVGDADEIMGQVKPFAEQLSVFDTAGKPLEIKAYESDEGGVPADLTGKWNVIVDAQGQEMPVTISLEQDGEKISGEMNSMLGDGKIESGSVSGSKFSATVMSEFQGQEFSLTLKGTTEGDSIVGTISIPMMPEPLGFRGTKE